MPDDSSRLPRFRKWGGVLLCAVILAAWVISLADPGYCLIGHDWLFLDNGRVGKLTLGSVDGGVMRWVGTSDLLRDVSISIPLWFLLVVAAWLTVNAFRRGRRCMPPGFCHVCSYDLTGNVSGRCPECGTPIRVLIVPSTQQSVFENPARAAAREATAVVRPKWRRVAKWMGAVCCVLIGAIWAATLHEPQSVEIGRRAVCAGRGGVAWITSVEEPERTASGFAGMVDVSQDLLLSTPCWFALLVVGTLTAILFWRDRKPTTTPGG